MELKIIKTKKDYLVAMERFEEIFSAKKGTKESDEADVLSLIIKDYEDKHYVIEHRTHWMLSNTVWSNRGLVIVI